MRPFLRAIGFTTIALLAFAASACGGASPVTPSAPHNAAHPITHVVIVVQENRSFNNLFLGFPGAATQPYGYASDGRKIALQPIGLATSWDIAHSSYSFLAACHGAGDYPGTGCRMNGFDKEAWYCGQQSEPKCPIALPPYAYAPREETKPYFYLGKHYVLADQMYASNFDGSSFVSHQYIIAAQASSSVNYPWYAWGCSGGDADYVPTVTQKRRIGSVIPVCFNNLTLGDELDEAGLSWAFYTSKINNGQGGFWSAYQAIEHIYDGPDWHRDVITPQTRFFADVAAGHLRTVSWITPTFKNSDHAGSRSDTGPSWVASIVNAIGKSPYWKNTAIFIFWDDYGGWYDPAPPQMVDYDGLGFRLPLLIVSAYAKAGYVTHVHYEHGSILRWIENNFGLKQLSASDTRAAPPDDAFDFAQPARAFSTVPATYDAGYFQRQPPDYRVPDSE
jgi:phospholipase C